MIDRRPCISELANVRQNDVPASTIKNYYIEVGLFENTVVENSVLPQIEECSNKLLSTGTTYSDILLNTIQVCITMLL